MQDMMMYDPTSFLTEQQIKFCEHYVKSGNGTRSAIKAGYSPRSATGMASELLKHAHVSAYLQQLREDCIATAPGLQRYWLKIMLDPEAKTMEQLRASELLGKAIGVFEDESNPNRPIEIIFTIPPQANQK